MGSRDASEKSRWLALFALFAALRAVAAVYSKGYNVPDELYQVLEPAFGLNSGYWYKTWEWTRGARSWFLPGLYGALMHLVYAVHSPALSRSENLVVVLRLVTGLASLVVPAWCWNIARDLYGRRVATWAALFGGLWWTSIYFGVHTLSENVAMLFALPALALARHARARDALWAGILLGLAFAVRFQSCLFAAGVGAFLLWRHAWRSLAAFCAGFIALFMLQGVLDLFTWGSFLHSFREYLAFNLVEGGAASRFGAAPWHHFLTALNRFFTLPLACVVVSFSAYHAWNSGRQKTLWLWLPFLAFWLPHNLTAHKEDRFILPLLPPLMLFTVFGIRDFFDKRPRSPAWKPGLALIFMGAFAYRSVRAPWTFNGGLTDLFVRLGREENLTGFGSYNAAIPSLFYLQRDIPAYRFETGDPAAFAKLVRDQNLNYIDLSYGAPGVLEALRSLGIGCSPAKIELSPLLYCDLHLSTAGNGH